ncbi:MAG: L,D-transpeptidase family protein [Gemmatimonadetes bacterium]|nr:L,D-transpeptidase family protein [Gemmatimonadota bacterium]
MYNHRSFFRPALIGAALLALGGCASLGALPVIGGGTSGDARVPGPREEVEPRTRDPLGGFHVVVDLDDNELRFMDGKQVVWAGPVGTGTGLRLRGEDSEWDFSTPNGTFYVQYKEVNPVWILPDWYFVKDKKPIPPEDSPARRVPGALGAAAVFLGDEIAIHGTDKPELLGQRVSHGCIRLSDENAKRLFHNVQVGTPVIITGGQGLAKRLQQRLQQSAAAPTNPTAQPKPPASPLARVSTQQLLSRLDRQLAAGDTSSEWTRTASEIIRRGIDDDSLALRGALALAGTGSDEATNREYSTFLADAFMRGSLRAIVSLARIDAKARERASLAIVEGVMDLHPGALDVAGAPWPTRRVPNWRLGPDGSRGWKALQQAEAAYRARPAGVRLVMGTAAQ